VSPVEGTQRDLDAAVGGHGSERLEFRHIPGDVAELSAGRARAHRGDADAAPPVLGGDSLGEVEHEGLGRGVRCHVRNRLEGRRAGQVDDAAGARPEAAREDRPGEFDEGPDVEFDHGHFAVRVEICSEGSPATVARIVDQDPGPPPQQGDDAAPPCVGLQVGGDDVGGDTMSAADLGSDCLQAIGAASDEGDVVAALGESAGKLGAEAARCTGDKHGNGRADGLAHGKAAPGSGRTGRES